MTVTLSQDLTFQLGDTGLLLNSDAVSGVPFVDIDKVSGLDNSPYRETKRDHEGVDGGFLDAEFETGRDITLEGILYSNGTAIEDFLDQLKSNYAPSTTLIPFYFTTQSAGTRLLMVKPRGVRYDWDDLRRLGCCKVQFNLYAEIPFILGNVLNSTNINVGATIFTGFSFNLAFSFGFGGTSSTGDGLFVNNNGNRPSPVILTISGTATNPIIYNDAVGKNLSFNITLGATETLVIDTYYHTVRLNGTTNRRSLLLNAGWFYLNPGPNFIKFRTTSSSDNGSLNLLYRSAWR